MTMTIKHENDSCLVITLIHVQVLTGVVESCLGGADVKETLESAKEEIEAIGK